MEVGDRVDYTPEGGVSTRRGTVRLVRSLGRVYVRWDDDTRRRDLSVMFESQLRHLGPVDRIAELDQ